MLIQRASFEHFKGFLFQYFFKIIPFIPFLFLSSNTRYGYYHESLAQHSLTVCSHPPNPFLLNQQKIVYLQIHIIRTVRFRNI